jgi:hypothetical protein
LRVDDQGDRIDAEADDEVSHENYWYELSIRRSAIQLTLDDHRARPSPIRCIRCTSSVLV